MSGSSLQFVILNSTTIENLSRKTVVWTLAVYMPHPPDVSTGFRTISFSAPPKSPSHRSDAQDSAQNVRTFAILHTKPGESPFDLGPLENFKSVMGDHWYDWLLPLKYSPCCDHSRAEGQFAWGPVLQRMRKEAGIMAPMELEKTYMKRRRRHSHHRSGSKVERTVKASRHHGRDETQLELAHGLGNGPERS